jgi:hypothetical protein
MSVTDEPKGCGKRGDHNPHFIECCKVYYLGMASIPKSRISHLRHEIAALQRDNELYRLKQIRSPLLVRANESRRFRLMEIQEELVTMGMAPRNMP